MSQRRMVWRHDLPLGVRTPSGKVLVSRLTLYEAIGDGPHRCHWCRCVIDWRFKSHPDALQVDHLDGDVSNDDLANLVPSCRRCNSARGRGVLWFILRDDIVLQTLALLAGPVKREFKCGHPFIESNIYVLGPEARSRHTCLTCHRNRALGYFRLALSQR